jgi:hypothetical protein
MCSGKEREGDMAVKTRIGYMGITNGIMGSVELPEIVTLYCPQCGTECADKGQCILSFSPINHETGKRELTVEVDCRSCGCYGKAPSLIGSI